MKRGSPALGGNLIWLEVKKKNSKSEKKHKNKWVN
jgi:hypothetical protein